MPGAESIYFSQVGNNCASPVSLRKSKYSKTKPALCSELLVMAKRDLP